MSEPVKTSRPVVFALPEAGKQSSLSTSQGVARPVTYDALVLDGRLRQALATVRSLGSRGLRVAVLVAGWLATKGFVTPYLRRLLGKRLSRSKSQ